MRTSKFKTKARRSIIGLFLFISCYTYGQEEFKIEGNTFLHKRIYFQDGDTISYLVNKTSFSQEKPTIFYFNGSFPTPLLIEWEDSELSMIPFTYYKDNNILENFNLVLVSKPYTPVIAKINELSNSCYVPNISEPNNWDERFVKCNNINYLGRRGAFLVDHLVNSELINSNSILAVGHSQGGLEVARMSSLCDKITDVVLLGAAPYGRLQLVSNSLFMDYRQGKIDFSELDKLQHQLSDDYKVAVEDVSQNAVNYSDVAFAEPAINDLIETKANILYLAGSHDDAAMYASQLAIDCFRRGKKNVEYKIYENSDHSFFHVDATGTVNYESDRWEQLFGDITAWFKGNHIKK